ncbi:2338_t:CDS:2, partial [Racocetra persica]
PLMADHIPEFQDESALSLGQSKSNLGVGILSLPLAFKYSGWIIGLSLFFFCTIVASHGARLLIKCLKYEKGLHTYPDIAAITYGEFAKSAIFALLAFEIFIILIILVNIIGDTLNTLYPDMSIVSLKIISWIVLVPLTLIDIKYLSYVSFLGILSTIFLALVILINGITNYEQPG